MALADYALALAQGFVAVSRGRVEAVKLAVIGNHLTFDPADIALDTSCDQGFDRKVKDEGPAFGRKRVGGRGNNNQAAGGLRADANQVV